MHMPTPHPESHIIVEILALVNGWPMAESDAIAAFLIAIDQAATRCKPVYMHPPKEWDLQEWLANKEPQLQEYFRRATTADVVWRQDGTATCMADVQLVQPAVPISGSYSRSTHQVKRIRVRDQSQRSAHL